MTKTYGCAVASLIVLTILSSGAATAGEKAPDDSRLTVERIFDSNEFHTEGFGPARWLEDGSGYTTLEDSSEIRGGRDVVQCDPETGERHILVSAKLLIPEGESKPLEISDYRWSRGTKKLLVFTDTKRVWRTNTRGDYWVLTLKNGKLQKLGGDAKPSTLMFAKFSPDGKRVAYVREHNLYVQDLKTLDITQLTSDGSATIINATSDWVYEEEFRLRDGFRWSPNGKLIAYWQFDSAGVRKFRMINYTDSLYPKLTTFAYPKVGQKNSACRVGVVPADGGETRWFETSDDPRNHYIPKMDWANDSKTIVLQQLNRLQNTNEVILVNTQSGKTRTVLTERDDAWLDVTDCLTWLDDGKRFTWLSERNNWQHLYTVSRRHGHVTDLTPEPFDVISCLKADEEGGWVYFIASPDDPTQRYLYRASLNGNGEIERITPVEAEGTHSYDISPDAKWAFHTYSSFGVPPVVELISLPEHETVRVLTDNSKLRDNLAKVDLGRTRLFRVNIGDGIKLDGWCIRPPGFDRDRQYPLLFHVYGEPAGQTVLDRWGGEKYLWHQMLAQHGYLVMSVDNRGTPAPRGREWRKCVYRQIGILASADQAAAASKIIESRPYVDPNRIGVWGWSGGGSMSLNAIFRYPDIYQTAMAIAFISNQRFYDTIYQERYMGLPDDNEQGFRDGSPVTFAHQLEGNLLLVYGTGDDNCHYQNCEVLVNELIKHNKPFSMMTYPNRTHSIREGENTKLHLFSLLTRYLQENLPAGPKAACRE